VLRKRAQLQELALVETTLMTGSKPARFRQAVDAATKLVAEDATSQFELAIDVSRARSAKIRPLDLGGSGQPSIAPKDTVHVAQEVGEAPVFDEELDRRHDPQPDRPPDRLETWKRNLLDLSLRNRLLNFKDTKATITIECVDPAALEDALADGKRFNLLGRTTVSDGSDGRDSALMAAQRNEETRKDFLLDAMGRGDLHTSTTVDEIEVRLTELFRAARLAFEEGGANVLYLCLGFLKWTPQESVGPYRAPLILLPVQLERKSVRSGFKLALHEDEARFNPTLLQMLKQDFALVLPELSGDLPHDASGIDIREIWTSVRRHVKHIKGWEVTEQVVLATLSFTKYLMWKDLVDREETLKRNRVVRHLIETPTHTYDGGSSCFVAPNAMDHVVDPSDLFTPLSADSSQLAAVVASQRGADFVLFGPPGTGKSQTIANAITNCLAHGKTVLFVSQKTAALEVVRQRMQGVGLGNYCLEVHSTKAQKSNVLEQLAVAWRERNVATEEDWNSAAAELAGKRGLLNRLVSALHRRRANGMTAYEVFGRVIADRGDLADVGLKWPTGTVHGPEDIGRMRGLCADMGTALLAVGNPNEHPLLGIRQRKWTPAWAQSLDQAVDRLQTSLRNVQVAARALAASIELRKDDWEDSKVVELIGLIGVLLQANAPEGGALLVRDTSDRARALTSMLDVVSRMRTRAAALSTKYSAKAAMMDIPALRAEWADACASNFVVRTSRKNKVRAALAPYCTGEVPEDVGKDLPILEDISGFLREMETLKPLFSGMAHLWRGAATDVSRFEAMIQWATDCRAKIDALADSEASADMLLENVHTLLDRDPGRFRQAGKSRMALERMHESWTSMNADANDLGELIGLAKPENIVNLKPGWIDELIERTARWKTSLIRAPHWAAWQTAAQAARAAGLGPLVDGVEAGDVKGDRLMRAFDYAYAKWASDAIVNEDEVLSDFLAERHEAAIGAFVAADQRVNELSRQIVKARIGASVPTQTNFGKDPEWGTLAREISKRARQMPLRQLFARIPNALTQLAPCVMMSPLSIAQYLPAESKPFDVVIFDEASQIPVWDAIGAIARGTQVVVVGDPEQLPPTNVGQRGTDDEAETDGGVVQNQQSILDECLASNLPSMRLSWHYRSRHESLIAFSNAKYYRGELVTFPSPVTRDTAVRYVQVEGGVYERGAAKVNRKEAEAVVAEVVARLKSSSHSVGVVTFNGEQQRLIENLLDQARRSDPSLEPHFDRDHTREPLLVKNIENVQGDERDVIIFSVAVGPDKTGRVTAQISSLNGEGGHRRLNVAITRARRELLVFATLRPEQINLGRTGARGVVDFKHFLEYAERGARAIAEAFATTGRETDSPFEDAVMKALEQKGWVVHPQVGVSYFRIDLGVVHPDFPGRYLAGVECDGATYHRSATARDRDRLREMVLTDLGWRIRRIWSTEWWIDASSALQKIHERLEADLIADRASRSEPVSDPDPVQETDASPSSDEQRKIIPIESLPPRLPPAEDELPAYGNDELVCGDETTSVEEPAKLYARGPSADDEKPELAPTYSKADLTGAISPDRDRFYDVDYRSNLRAMVEHVVSLEGPIYFDVLVDRLARAHGILRSGETVQKVVRAALGRGRFASSREGDRQVVWQSAEVPKDIVAYRNGSDRDHGDIPLGELAGLASLLAKQGLEDEEILRAMQLHFKLGRLAASTRERFEEAIAIFRQGSLVVSVDP
jgi:very-short-patch-repair endonuclease